VLDMNLKNPFTVDQLKQYWNEFAQKLKQEKRDIEYSIIANRELVMDEHFTIFIKLDNGVQLDQLNTFNVEMMGFLRKSLKNNHVLLRAEVSATEAKKVIYTSEDKFKYLLEKYPILDDLKRRLGLETDF
jgi:DNA polymerase-3 subunit gamma/tau